MSPSIPANSSSADDRSKTRQNGADSALVPIVDSEGNQPLLNEETVIPRLYAASGNRSCDCGCLCNGTLGCGSILRHLHRRMSIVFEYALNHYGWMVVVALVGQSVNATCFKILARENINVFQAVELRSIVCGLFTFMLCRMNGLSLFEPREKIPFFFLRGLTGGTAFALLAIAWCYLPLSESAFMTNSYPVVTAVFSWLIGMEDLRIASWIGVFGCIVGNALFARPSFLFGGDDAEGFDRTVGLIASCLGNLFMGIAYITIKYIGRSMNTLALTMYLHFFTCLFSLPFMLAGFPEPMRMSYGPELVCYAGVCLTGMISQLAMSRALQIGPPTKVTSIFMLNMLLSAFVGIVALDESMSWLSLIGATLIIGSVILVTVQKRKRTNQYESLPSSDNQESQT